MAQTTDAAVQLGKRVKEGSGISKRASAFVREQAVKINPRI